MKATRLNNRKLAALRKDMVYEAVMTDLVLIGALDKEVVEQLIGRQIGEFLRDPTAAAVETPTENTLPNDDEVNTNGFQQTEE